MPKKPITLDSFTPADLANYRTWHADEWRRWWDAVHACYMSIEHLEVQAAVDQVPVLLVSRFVTYAALLGLGGGDPAIREKVLAKKVEMRLAS